jgi:hypothetical protein
MMMMMMMMMMMVMRFADDGCCSTSFAVNASSKRLSVLTCRSFQFFAIICVYVCSSREVLPSWIYRDCCSPSCRQLRHFHKIYSLLEQAETLLSMSGLILLLQTKTMHFFEPLACNGALPPPLLLSTSARKYNYKNNQPFQNNGERHRAPALG